MSNNGTLKRKPKKHVWRALTPDEISLALSLPLQFYDVQEESQGEHKSTPQEPHDTHDTADELFEASDELSVEIRELQLQNDLKRAKIEANILENYAPNSYGPQWGGSDNYEFGLNRNVDGLWVPMATGSDRKGGGKWPLWRNDGERHRMMQASRMCVGMNSYAQGLLRNLTNHVIGTGLRYKTAVKATLQKQWRDEAREQEEQQQNPTDAVSMLMGQLAQPNESKQKLRAAEKIVNQVQDWLDDFCARNTINAEASPVDEDEEDGAVNSASSTVEREAYWRVQRDGECFIRLFKMEDGTVEVRFVGPEMIWGQPPGQSQDDGWYYGVQHRVTANGQIDLGKVLAYYVRPRDVTFRGENNVDGEIVPAVEMIHIKDDWEDAEVSRGTPAFSGDLLDALNRASRLQRNMSISSAVRAARAEVWKHSIGTLGQIQALQQGPSSRQVADGWGGTRTENPHLTIPGSVARIPQGQEPVPFSVSTNIPDHQQAAQGDLRQACAGFCAPEYMSGSTNDANFATAREAGTPFVLAAEAEQVHYKMPFLRLMWRVVRWAVQQNKLPAEAMTICDIQVEGREAAARNETELSSARKDNMEMKLVSPQAEIMKLGGDPHQVMADWKEWNEKMTEANPMQSGMGGDKEEGEQQGGDDDEEDAGEKKPGLQEGLTFNVNMPPTSTANLQEGLDVSSWHNIPGSILDLLQPKPGTVLAEES